MFPNYKKTNLLWLFIRRYKTFEDRLNISWKWSNYVNFVFRKKSIPRKNTRLLIKIRELSLIFDFDFIYNL